MRVLFVCLCIRKHSDKGVLNGGKYDISWDYEWDYDVYSLKCITNYSKPLVIWVEGSIIAPPPQ